MGQGSYDHPSYITRQQIALGRTTAGASGVSIQAAFPSAMRLRTVTASVVTAGTTASAASGFIIKSGTTALGTISLSTNIAGVVASLADVNAIIPTGTVLSVTNGADATVVGYLTAEMYLDQAASWTGNG